MFVLPFGFPLPLPLRLSHFFSIFSSWFSLFVNRDHKKLRQHVKTETSFGVLLFGQLNSMLHFLKSKESKALCSLFHFLKPEEQKALCSRFRLFSFSTNLTSFQFLKSEKPKNRKHFFATHYSFSLSSYKERVHVRL